MAVNPVPAYGVYNRTPLPSTSVTTTAPNGKDGNALASYAGSVAKAQTALTNWLGKELLTVQRAIPQRFTKTVTASYTLLTTDDVLLVDATAGPITITWPDPTRAQHFNCTVKKIDASANAVTFASTIASTATAATFDGVTSPTLVSRWDSREYRSNGVQYYQKVAGVVAIFTGSVPAANVTSGTFGSASSDTGVYKFPQSAVAGQNNKPSTLSLEGTGGVTVYGDVGTSTAAGIRLINIATQSIFNAFRTDGTAASPTAIASGDILGIFRTSGYDGTATGGSGATDVRGLATQNWTNAAHGSKLVFFTVPNGFTALTTALTLDQDQSATFAGAVTASTTLGVTGASSLVGAVSLGNAASTGGIMKWYQNSTLSWQMYMNSGDTNLYLFDNVSGALAATVHHGATPDWLFAGAVSMGALSATTGSFSGAFACNGNTAQTKAVSGGTLGGVIAALVANGILSS